LYILGVAGELGPKAVQPLDVREGSGKEIGVQVADSLMSTLGLVRYPLSEGILIAEVPVHPSMERQPLEKLRLTERFGVHVVALETPAAAEGEGEESPHVDLQVPPDPSAPLQPRQVLVLLGDEKGMSALADAYGD